MVSAAFMATEFLFQGRAPRIRAVPLEHMRNSLKFNDLGRPQGGMAALQVAPRTR
jgi:hypothetical protein